MPSATHFDRYQSAIDWLIAALGDTAAYPFLNRCVLPRLHGAVASSYAAWVQAAPNQEIPALVLSVHRWRKSGGDPSRLLRTLERGFHFYSGNRDEIGNLSGQVLHPMQSSSVLLQCMVVASLIDSLGGDRVHPSNGPRPDVYARLVDRDVAIEVTSRNHDRGQRAMLASGGVSGGTLDPYAEDSFNVLWDRTISHKLADVSRNEPWILFVWDCDILSDLVWAVSEDNPIGVRFSDLLRRYRKDCSPLSGFVYLPYSYPAQVPLCDVAMSNGRLLDTQEAEALRAVFADSPVLRYGIWAPDDL